MLEVGCPKRLKSYQDPAVPFFYSVGGSWESQGQVPWNAVVKRAMTPAEGIEWLATELAEAKAALTRERASKRKRA